MTRKEAINLIGWLKSKTNREDDLEAIDMAIEALKRVVMTDFYINGGEKYFTVFHAENTKGGEDE